MVTHTLVPLNRLFTNQRSSAEPCSGPFQEPSLYPQLSWLSLIYRDGITRLIFHEKILERKLRQIIAKRKVKAKGVTFKSGKSWEYYGVKLEFPDQQRLGTRYWSQSKTMGIRTGEVTEDGAGIYKGRNMVAVTVEQMPLPPKGASSLGEQIRHVSAIN
jgi:hypothetical protein